MQNEAKKVIITGGAGYIGSHTAIELIEAGFTPIIVDNFSNSTHETKERIKEITGHEVTQYEVDCNNVSALENIFEIEGKINAVIHFAASKYVSESTKKPLTYYQNNIDSLLHVLQCIEKYEVKNFIFSSSCTIYGEADTLPVDENAPMKKTSSPYGRTKQMAEEIITDWMHSVSHNSAISLRYFNPIGAHPSAKIGEQANGTPENLLPYLLQSATGGKPLTVFGNDYPTIDGTCVRDYIHVVDLAKAHVSALTWLDTQPLATYETFNVGVGNGVSVLELITLFEEKNNVKVPYQIGSRRPGDLAAIYADSTKVSTTIGWKPKYSVADALEHSWKWHQYVQNKNE